MGRQEEARSSERLSDTEGAQKTQGEKKGMKKLGEKVAAAGWRVSRPEEAVLHTERDSVCSYVCVCVCVCVGGGGVTDGK